MSHSLLSGDLFNIFVQKNVRVSQVTVSDILGSDHLPTIFHLLDHVRTRNRSDPVDTQIGRGFKAQPELISPGI
jgi:hypothetical protein